MLTVIFTIIHTEAIIRSVVMMSVILLNVAAPRGLYYKTFYGSNFCRILISQSVVTASHFHPHIIIAGKARAHPYGVNCNYWLSALPINIRLG